MEDYATNAVVTNPQKEQIPVNADLTIDTLSFKLVYSDKGGSVRRETSRGASLPEDLTIRHSTVTDSATKLKSRRSVVRFDRYIALADGSIAPVSTYAVHQSPIDTEVDNAEIVAVTQRLCSLLSDEATTGLDLKEEIFANGEQ